MWNLVGTVGISVSFESLRCQVPFVAGAQDGVDDGRGNLATGGVWVRSRVAMASLLAFLPRRHWRADPPRGSMARLHTVGALPALPQFSADIHKGKEGGGEDTSTFRRRPMGRTPTIGGRTMGRAVGHGPEGQRGHLPLQPAGMDSGKRDQKEAPPGLTFGTDALESNGGPLFTEGDKRHGGDVDVSAIYGVGRTGDELTTAEGEGSGYERYVMAGYEEAQFERQLATVMLEETKGGQSDLWEMKTWDDEEEVNETVKEGEGKAEIFEFPPSPPVGKSEKEDEEVNALVHLVKRRRNGNMEEAGEARKRQKKEEERGKIQLRHEGTRATMPKSHRRPDIPQQPAKNPKLRGNQKWLKAIRTAKMFRSGGPKNNRTLVNFKKGYYANSSRRARASVRKTVDKILLNLGVKGSNECWTPETLEQVGAVLKSSEYKAGVTYLSEYKIMAIETGVYWSQQLQRAYTQATRALNRAKGPPKKAKEVEEDRWFTACKAELNEVQRGAVHYPALLFAFATTWMLREVELAAIYKEDIVIEEKELLVALTLRITKGDQEAKGLKRTLQCSCRGDCNWQRPCPYKITKATLETVPVETDKLVCGDGEGEVSKDQLISAWRKCFGKSISGHSGRRSGALQYIRKGWQVPQVAYLGRWKSNVILQYAEEALETMPVRPKPQGEGGSEIGDVNGTKALAISTMSEQDAKALAEVKDTERKLKKEIQFLKATQEKLDESIVKWEAVSKENHGLLPPTVISRGGTVHENRRQPIASPVLAWHTRCGWPFGSSAFSFGLDVSKVSCQKCLLLAQSNEERCGKGGG